MLINRNHSNVLKRLFFLTVLLLAGMWARSQGAVYVLKTAVEDRANRDYSAPAEAAGEQSFDFHRNLIFFPARLNGKQGNFILDTGAPTLLINRRDKFNPQSVATGYGAGGEVEVETHRIESLEFAGQHHGRTWALALDLRAMEKRTGRTIDGFVGYEQLWNRELRIDYTNETFSIRKSVRRPQHDGRNPDQELDLDFSGHLPIVIFRIGKRRLRFILDTGAAVNLLDDKYADIGFVTGERMNIQGIDGRDQDCTLIALPEPQKLKLSPAQRTFVSMNLDHLQQAGEAPVAGILGSDFLEQYAVGIDYRRGKLYIWNPTPQPKDYP